MSIRISQVGIEVIRKGSPKFRISQVGIEVLRENVPCDWFIEDIELRFYP